MLITTYPFASLGKVILNCNVCHSHIFEDKDDVVIEDYSPTQGGSAKARADAEGVLVSMQGIVDRYSVVRISDLYDLVGLTGVPSDYDYGWTNLNGASVRRVSGGWLLVLPKAMPIDNI